MLFQQESRGQVGRGAPTGAPSRGRSSCQWPPPAGTYVGSVRSERVGAQRFCKEVNMVSRSIRDQGELAEGRGYGQGKKGKVSPEVQASRGHGQGVTSTVTRQQRRWLERRGGRALDTPNLQHLPSFCSKEWSPTVQSTHHTIGTTSNPPLQKR